MTSLSAHMRRFLLVANLALMTTGFAGAQTATVADFPDPAFFFQNSSFDTSGDVGYVPTFDNDTLWSFSLVTGVLLGGGLANLESSDESYIHTRSGFGETLVDLHNMEVRIIAVNDLVQNPVMLDLTIESRISEPAGTTQARLHNWTTDAFDLVGAYPIGDAGDQVDIIDNISATGYVREAGAAEIEPSIKHIVFVPFFALTFESFIDQVEIVAR